MIKNFNLLQFLPFAYLGNCKNHNNGRKYEQNNGPDVMEIVDNNVIE